VQSEFGIGLCYDDINSNELSHVRARKTFINAISLGDVDQINGSAYSDLRYNLTEKFVANAGVRLDVFSFQYVDKLNGSYGRQSERAAVFSPKLNLSYNANSNFQFYLKSGYGFHSNDSRMVVEHQARELLPKAFGNDLGFFAKPFKNLLMNVAVWQLKLEQEFVYVGDEAVVEPSGETQRYGIDLSARYQALCWLYIDLDANYSSGESVEDPEGENYIPLAPRFTSIGGVTANLKNRLHASLRYRWVGDRPANEDNSVVARGYFLLDATFSYMRRTFDLSLSATNLTPCQLECGAV
jgi:outer membrane receptor protein involved in Fe transport